MLSKDAPCCEMMSRQLNQHCPDHPDPWDCPDALVGISRDGRVGLIVHDGEVGTGSSAVLIAYCPWCARPTGTSLDEG